MAQAKKGKVIQMLSPINYIRQKARSLPLYECMVNSDWKTSQLANLVIARKHSNGNITAGLYLVDLLCLGIKDTTWFFNIPEREYREKMEHFTDMHSGVEKIRYELAHNIVFAGLEFAGDYEFQPHKDFTSVTRFILDEDTDKIPLIEIECGMNGMPAYMQGPLHSDAKARQIIAHLDRVAGPGNYILMGEDGILNNEEEWYDEDEDDYEEEEENPFAPMDFEEKKERFLNITSQMEEFDEKKSISLYHLCQSLIDDLLDVAAYNQWFDAFDAELGKIGVNDDTIPDEMLGKAPGQAPFHQKIKEQFLEILEISAPMETKKTLFDAFCTNPGVEAAAAYLELALAEQEQSKKYASLLKKAAKKYPGYSLIQIRRAESEILDADPQKDHSISRLFNDFFFGRDAIHPFEFHALLHLKTQALAAEQNLEKTEAWKNILDHYIQESNMAHIMTTIVSLLQIPMIAIRLEKEQNRKG